MPSAIGWERFYAVVRRIPRGRVATYGGVAALAGHPRAARHVGYAMAALRGAEHDVPWHRVLGARTKRYAVVSIKDPTGGGLQRHRLEAEGVRFDALGRVALGEHGWDGAARRGARAAGPAPRPSSPRKKAARR